ncbi:alpha/beta hydrolase [Dietzia sp. NPDC055343]
MPFSDDAALMLEGLNAGFPRVELMTGPQARAAVLARKQLAETPVPVDRVEQVEIPGPGGALPLRIYTPGGATGVDALPAVVFAHGGGFVFCDLDTHDEFCRVMANGVGAVVLSVDYRLAPEHPAPAAARDLHAALEWTVAKSARLGIDPRRVVVAGDSAGGNLAAVTSLMARDQGGPELAGQVLLYPVISDDFQTESYEKFSTGYFNTRAAMQWYWQQYAPAPIRQGIAPHLLSPARAETLAGLPPTIVVTAACDPLSDEGSHFAESLHAAGVPTIHRHYEDIFHGFMTIPSLGITQTARSALWSDLANILQR